eukprot:Hpha_TRINITY_DN13671_c0_g1::TRINITY_DN13671_c0_g1_i1::g.122524::m.122524
MAGDAEVDELYTEVVAVALVRLLATLNSSLHYLPLRGRCVAPHSTQDLLVPPLPPAQPAAGFRSHAQHFAVPAARNACPQRRNCHCRRHPSSRGLKGGFGVARAGARGGGVLTTEADEDIVGLDIPVYDSLHTMQVLQRAQHVVRDLARVPLTDGVGSSETVEVHRPVGILRHNVHETLVEIPKHVHKPHAVGVVEATQHLNLSQNPPPPLHVVASADKTRALEGLHRTPYTCAGVDHPVYRPERTLAQKPRLSVNVLQTQPLPVPGPAPQPLLDHRPQGTTTATALCLTLPLHGVEVFRVGLHQGRRDVKLVRLGGVSGRAPISEEHEAGCFTGIWRRLSRLHS